MLGTGADGCTGIAAGAGACFFLALTGLTLGVLPPCATKLDGAKVVAGIISYSFPS
jgi:hypothetical protein